MPACLGGLVLISIPFLGQAADSATDHATAQPASPVISAPAAGLPALTNIVSLTNGTTASFSIEFSLGESAALSTNSPTAIALTVTLVEGADSDFGKFVIRHMTRDQEYRFVSCDTGSGRIRKALATVSAGYGEFFNEDTDSETFRGDNGARRESPGFLYVRTGFNF